MSDIKSNIKDVEKKISRITPKFIQGVTKIIKTHDYILTSHVRDKYMTGGTSDNRLAVRTGRLRASTKALPIKQTAGIINGGIGIGPLAYQRVHIGPKGQVTTIVPKKKKWLTIPLEAAKTKAGVTRGSAKSNVWGETEFKRGVFSGGTFIQKSKGGKLFIFGKRVIQKGSQAGKTKGPIVPLFLLVKQVKIKARVHPEDILAWSKNKIVEDFKEIGMELIE